MVYRYTKERLLEIDSQQRLDKILSKFEDTEQDTMYYNLIDDVDNSMVNIVYIDKFFYLELFNNRNDDRLETDCISLETVESLLKDLEIIK